MTLVARHGALTDIGLHRKTNEDTFVVQPPLYAVCDGMGGANAGEVASGLAAETLAAEVARGTPLHAAAEAANAAVFQRAHDNVEQTGMGTTLTAFVLEGDTARFAHIGDSRAYLLRDGELRQVSDDHSLVGEMVRDGRLTEEEAAVHPHRSILSRALGTEPQARIDEFTEDLLPGDVLLLCSDGLSGPVPADAIRVALTRSDPQQAAERLILEARRAGRPRQHHRRGGARRRGPARRRRRRDDAGPAGRPGGRRGRPASCRSSWSPASRTPSAGGRRRRRARRAAAREQDGGTRPPARLAEAARRRKRSVRRLGIVAAVLRAARRRPRGRRLLPQHRVLRRRRRRHAGHLQRRAGQDRPRPAARRVPAQRRDLRLAHAGRAHARRRAAAARPRVARCRSSKMLGMWP